jgi:cytochrome c oxidase subunit 3
MKPPFPSSSLPPLPPDFPGSGDDHAGRPDEPAGDFRFRVAPDSRIGLLLFLASLAMLFAASLLCFVIVRYTTALVPPGYLTLPPGFWVSTAVLLAAGVAIHRASRLAVAGRDSSLRLAMASAWSLSAAFICVQAPCLMVMARAHSVLVNSHVALYGAVLTLIAIHALHVVGGMVPLSMLTFRATCRNLSAADRRAIRSCALYWHFLEVVWVVMFTVFLIVG